MKGNHKRERDVNIQYKNLKELPVWQYNGEMYTVGDFLNEDDIILTETFVVYRANVWQIDGLLPNRKVRLKKTFSSGVVTKYTSYKNLRKIVKYNKQ